ncbi:delta-1-pyrroline-5-carboxylate dehydrogenase, mitochondrial [Phlebotomus argentipes]|uniref:delta-1-pyrroline-5-carboxylate dehydrogenase, mitochondrial n=1 Tax=Phlebotomus argentipes TaxID=94469 RepID=UPI00289342F4|nr:delta-1-pyrroline-5-carboxylate dehydrogenase, mitochondrial [Phlebotomus argentipes]
MIRCTQTVSATVRARWSCQRRWASSVVGVEQLPDFPARNEPVLGYLSGSPERQQLQAALQAAAAECQDVPIVVGGEEIRTKDVRYQVMPHDHGKRLAKFYYADAPVIQRAIDVATKAQREWDRRPLSERLDIWERAAKLMAGEWRARLNAATMLGQSKTAIQAEIDSAAELVDFIRLNAFFLKEAAKYQPISPDPAVTRNTQRFRGIDGFVAAVSPFNFTAIGGNLAYTPALAGNSVLWKPSDTALLSNWHIYRIMTEAGVPPGVVNFVPADGPTFGATITASPHLAGINFTGSVPTFQWLWRAVAKNLDRYVNFPRLIGECGGKNFHFVHPSAHVESVVAGTLRSSFEFCGQKCSACSRLYVPRSLWDGVREGLVEGVKKLKIGDPTDFSTFAGAVIDAAAYKRISGYIEHARKSPALSIVAGGKCDDSKGYFIQPTIVETTDPRDRIMTEEIFGPVLTVYVYEDKTLDAVVDEVTQATKFALTGAVFAQDESFLRRALEAFKMSAGNFYINDKSTGSVVGQQPFGGGRMSGTNDKAGGPHYVLRWTSAQAIKETYAPQTDVDYPYMR